MSGEQGRRYLQEEGIMLSSQETSQVIERKHVISIRCPVHHIKYERNMGCPECHRSKLHERHFIASNVIWKNPEDTE